MLNVLRDKLGQELKDVQELVSVSQGDIRNFRSNREYPLVIIPFRPLQHMYTWRIRSPHCKLQLFILKREGLWSLMCTIPGSTASIQKSAKNFLNSNGRRNRIPARLSDAISQKSQSTKSIRTLPQLLSSARIRAKSSSRKKLSRSRCLTTPTLTCAHSFC